MISDKKKMFMGIEVGGTKLQLVAGTAGGEIVERKRYTIVAAEGAKKIREHIQEGVEKLLVTNNIQSIGVGFGGPVNWRTGEIETSHQINGWSNYPMKEWLKKLSGLPVSVDNDANVAALAESIHGCGKGLESVFYMTIGSGIGGGMIVNGDIFRGRRPGEVEIGHIRLNKNGITVEEKCSGWAVNQKVRTQIIEHPGGILAKLAENTALPEAYFLAQALIEKDPQAVNIFNEITDDLAFALSHVVHLLNPHLIVIGGGLSLLNAPLSETVENKLQQYVMSALLPVPEVKIAILGEDVVPIGALELARCVFQSKNN